MEILKNIFGIMMNLIMTIGFIVMIYIDKAIIFLKKDNKMLDFIKKSLYL
tara:strand:+ start:127 stop:276 length:150 start_codon:yes stop_codon:yes gene_type:complete